MNNEQNKPREDRLVSDAYKELARERAPDNLNKRILGLAAGNRRIHYSRSRAWMRPVAWAATIGLSLAIVLELTRLPQIEPALGPETVGVSSSDEIPVPGERTDDESRKAKLENETPAAAERVDAVHDKPATPAVEQQDHDARQSFAPKKMEVLREAEDRARAQAGPDPASVDTAAERSAAERSASEPSASEPLASEPLASKTNGNAAEVDDAPVEELAAADSVVEFSASRSLAAVAEKNDLAAAASCSAEERKTAESWFSCIRGLRDRGLQDIADREYDEFRQEFPEFTDPGPDK